MSSSILRLYFAAMTVLIAIPTFAQEQTTDKPPKKKQEVVEDPFAEIPSDPIPLTQEDEPADNSPKVEDPFRLIGEPVERMAERPIKDPFAPINGTPPGKTQIPNNQSVIPQNPIPKTQTSNPQEDPKIESTSQQKLPAEETFEKKFWEYLDSNAYENWAPAPGQNGDFYQGRGPHGDFLKMYLNRTAAASPDELPNGSIIVKENYAADKETLAAITVMYRSKGYNKDAGDWYWIKYNPDGSIATTPEASGANKIMGKPNSCIECHGGAAGNDFTFFNDK